MDRGLRDGVAGAERGSSAVPGRFAWRPAAAHGPPLRYRRPGGRGAGAAGAAPVSHAAERLPFPLDLHAVRHGPEPASPEHALPPGRDARGTGKTRAGVARRTFRYMIVLVAMSRGALVMISGASPITTVSSMRKPPRP